MIRAVSADAVSSLLHARACVATIGNFDGVHAGHRSLLDRASERARELGLPAVAVTFDPHPVEVLSSGPVKFLCSLGQRLELLEAAGMDAVVVLPFSRAVAAERAEDFCRRVFADGLHVRELVVGHDFKMGCDRAGADLLGGYGDWSLIQMDPFLYEGLPVSSTRIRTAVAEGSLTDVSAMLGRPFSVRGTVVHGEGRGGPMLGFPTANLDFGTRQAMVRPSVYATAARILDSGGGDVLSERGGAFHGPHCGGWFKSMTSFCKNPTFGGDVLTLETHILDFAGDIYGRELEVCFLSELRPDRRFNGLGELKDQLCRDREARRGMALI